MHAIRHFYLSWSEFLDFSWIISFVFGKLRKLLPNNLFCGETTIIPLIVNLPKIIYYPAIQQLWLSILWTTNTLLAAFSLMGLICLICFGCVYLQLYSYSMCLRIHLKKQSSVYTYLAIVCSCAIVITVDRHFANSK